MLSAEELTTARARGGVSRSGTGDNQLLRLEGRAYARKKSYLLRPSKRQRLPVMLHAPLKRARPPLSTTP